MFINIVILTIVFSGIVSVIEIRAERDKAMEIKTFGKRTKGELVKIHRRKFRGVRGEKYKQKDEYEFKDSRNIRHQVLTPTHLYVGNMAEDMGNNSETFQDKLVTTIVYLENSPAICKREKDLEYDGYNNEIRLITLGTSVICGVMIYYKLNH